MKDLPLGGIAALVPEFAVKDLPFVQNTDDDCNINNPIARGLQ